MFTKKKKKSLTEYLAFENLCFYIMTHMLKRNLSSLSQKQNYFQAQKTQKWVVCALQCQSNGKLAKMTVPQKPLNSHSGSTMLLWQQSEYT